MAIPDFQSLMLPLLQYLSDKKEHSNDEIINEIANRFHLSDSEKNELLPSGRQSVFSNRIAWAKTHMKMAGLLENPRRGYFKISKIGLDVINKNPPHINLQYLNRFPEYVEFRNTHHEKPSSKENTHIDLKETPEEAFESAFEKIRNSLASEVLDKLKSCSPAFFERLVVEVIVKMGYGGNLQDAGKAIGRAKDGGIDGIIKEDKLGLDVIYIQAKRWENTVGRPEIQKFVGALTGMRANKGLFITTSDFSKVAKGFVSQINSKIVLIDGDMLAQLMIDFNVGVSIISSYDLKKIGLDYFIED